MPDCCRISVNFHICPVNPSSLYEDLSDNLKIKNNVELFADLHVQEILDQVTSNLKQSP